MAAPAVAAVIVRREKDLVAHFEHAGAVAATSARSPAELGVHEQLAWRRLLDRAVIRAAAPGTYYLDRPSWEALRRTRRRLALVLAVVGLLFALLPLLITGTFR